MAWQPTPVFLPGEFHVQRSLVGDSPWGSKESDMNEYITTMSSNERAVATSGIHYNWRQYQYYLLRLNMGLERETRYCSWFLA